MYFLPIFLCFLGFLSFKSLIKKEEQKYDKFKAELLKGNDYDSGEIPDYMLK